MRYPELRNHGIPWSQTHIGRMEKAGKFPKRVRLSDGTHAWVGEEIVGYVAEKVAARDEPTDNPEQATG